MKVECIRLDDMGRGIALPLGKTTFINNLLPNEEALIKITQDKKNYSEGEVIKLLKKSSKRITPKCPYLNCGCHLKHLVYEEEIKYKEEKLKNILNKFGVSNVKINSMVYDNNVSHYRNKITLKVNNGVGYYSNKTNNFIKIDRCELVSEKVNKLISILNKEDLSNVKEIEIKDFNELMITISGKMEIKNIDKYADIIYMNGLLIKGKPYTETSLNGLTFKISNDSFFQVNKTMTEKLYEIAIKYLGQNKNKTVLDLYCGTGTISLILSQHFKKVIGVEINEEAVKCANINKEINNINNVDFICDDVSKIKDLKADMIVVDPPRKGLTKEGINEILKINPETLVYISCNPITLARDLKLFSDEYIITDITPVNMFPRTYHMEVVARLQKK